MNMVSPTPLFTKHFGVNSRGLSPRLWSKISAHGAAPDGSSGFFVSDDFLQFGGVFTVDDSALTTVPADEIQSTYNGHIGYFDIGASALRSATDAGGVVNMITGATDNNLAILGSNILGEISRTAGEEKLTIFEARVRFSQVTSGAAFVGLGVNAMLADGGLVVDTGAPIDGGCIGFSVLDADPDALTFVYDASGQSLQTVATLDSTIDASTWYKVGFVFNPRAPQSERITIYVDGVEQSSFVTDTNMAAATFPNSVMMGMVAAVKADSTNTKTLSLDWLAYYQEG